MYLRRLGPVILLLFSICLTGAWAQSTLHMGGGAGSPCATGCGGHPNLLNGATRVDIYQNSGGATLSNQPVLLIFGVPSQFGNLFPLRRYWVFVQSTRILRAPRVEGQRTLHSAEPMV